MTDTPKPPNTTAANLLDALNSKIGKIVTLFVTIGALGTAVLTLSDVGKKLFKPKEEPIATRDPRGCFQAELNYPQAVPLSQWDSMEMRLTGNNQCAATLAVYLAFRARVDRIRLEPPYEAPEPECWEHKTLPNGEVNWNVSPPRLVLLKSPLGEKVRVDINWVVYNEETKAQVRADTAKFWLKDDQPPVTANLLTPAPLWKDLWFLFHQARSPARGGDVTIEKEQLSRQLTLAVEAREDC